MGIGAQATSSVPTSRCGATLALAGNVEDPFVFSES
jgi:hypothetical protein